MKKTQDKYRLEKERFNKSIYSEESDIRSFTAPLIINFDDTIPFELLFAQLNDSGRVSSIDYLAQSRLALQTSNVEDFDQTSSR